MPNIVTSVNGASPARTLLSSYFTSTSSSLQSQPNHRLLQEGFPDFPGPFFLLKSGHSICYSSSETLVKRELLHSLM